MHTYFGDSWKLLLAARVKVQSIFLAKKISQQLHI